jgi:5-methylcytosine-specific restriction endonuclease McrA
MNRSNEWLKAKRILINDLKKTGEYNIVGQKVSGICRDCGHYKRLTPDHIIKRSQGGKHTKENIDWVCLHCHIGRDQMGSKKSTKKASWQLPHKCKSCKKEVGGLLICPHCKKMSA